MTWQAKQYCLRSWIKIQEIQDEYYFCLFNLFFKTNFRHNFTIIFPLQSRFCWPCFFSFKSAYITSQMKLDFEIFSRDVQNFKIKTLKLALSSNLSFYFSSFIANWCIIFWRDWICRGALWIIFASKIFKGCPV